MEVPSTPQARLAVEGPHMPGSVRVLDPDGVPQDSSCLGTVREWLGVGVHSGMLMRTLFGYGRTEHMTVSTAGSRKPASRTRR